ncbi:hypothetical protein TRAPUB_6895 [Trametes pubescens]|uniref:Uncharacterized protein n=1 Tax=Trametes pubescens TaxID=154538 RepID=A0A1M2V4U2_TRAPU|nr:hypothetical protein TRAPUB_6895 [Trametes pubescens]
MDIDTASTAVMNMSNAICSFTHRLDKDVNDLKREYNLPPNPAEWATTVAQRLFARNEAFHVRARNELDIYRDFLLRLYPLSGFDLLQDLSTAMEEMRQSFSTARDLWYRFAFLFEAYFLQLSEGVRQELDSARDNLEVVFRSLTEALSALEISVASRQDCFESLMTEGGYSSCLEQLQERSTWRVESFVDELAPYFDNLEQLFRARPTIRTQCSGLCEQQVTAWYEREEHHISASEFLVELDRYSEYSRTVSDHQILQPYNINGIKTFIAKAACKASRLETISGVEKPLRYFIRGYEWYDKLRTSCMKITAHCSDAALAIRENLELLEVDRASP